MNSQKDPTKLIHELAKQFPIDFDQDVTFRFYPFCNERYFLSTVCTYLQLQERSVYKNKIKTAILFGESYLISLSPELLALGFECIISADIQPKLHQHIIYLLNCLKKSNTRDEFIHHYYTDNPPENQSSNRKSVKKLKDIRKDMKNEKNYFLNNEHRFSQCKQAMEKLKIVNICFDVMNLQQCYKLVNCVNIHGGELAFFNFTNIHQYDTTSTMITALPLLLIDSHLPFIASSFYFIENEKRHFDNQISNGLDNYFRIYDKESLCPTFSEFKLFNKFRKKLDILKDFNKRCMEKKKSILLLHQINQLIDRYDPLTPRGFYVTLTGDIVQYLNNKDRNVNQAVMQVGSTFIAIYGYINNEWRLNLIKDPSIVKWFPESWIDSENEVYISYHDPKYYCLNELFHSVDHELVENALTDLNNFIAKHKTLSIWTSTITIQSFFRSRLAQKNADLISSSTYKPQFEN